MTDSPTLVKIATWSQLREPEATSPKTKK